MSPQDFYKTYKPFAVKCEQDTGLSFLATLTQAAMESGWGAYVVGNNFFGIKDTDGINGNEQLVTTTEVLNNPNAKFPVIISIVKKYFGWLYTIKDYFRKYDTPAQSFADHANFFIKNDIYSKAWATRSDPEQFLREVARAGYATDPNYENELESTLRWFQYYSHANPNI